MFEQVTQPQHVAGQRVSALSFGNQRVMALLQALCLFALLPQGFRAAHLRPQVAELLGLTPHEYSSGRMTYDLRRLRLHGLIERIPQTQRYVITPLGQRVAMFFTNVDARVLRPGLSQLLDGCPNAPARPLNKAINELDNAFNQLISEAKLAA